MSEKKRRNFTSQEKVRILRLHLVERREVSDVCDEHGLQPSMFHRWMKEFFEKGHRAFERDGRGEKARDRKLARLEEKLQHKDGVIAELMGEHIALKKSLGEI